MHIVGIDPGLAGAVAVLDANGTLEALADTPTLVLKVQRGTRQVYDVPGMAALLRPYAGLAVPCVHRGIATDARTGYALDVHHGYGYGLWIGLLDHVTAPVYSLCARVSGSARWH